MSAAPAATSPSARSPQPWSGSSSGRAPSTRCSRSRRSSRSGSPSDRAPQPWLWASIPAVQTIASGHVGLHIGLGDLLLLLLVLAALGAATLERDAATFTALRPVRWPALQYCVFVLVLLFAHPGFQATVQTFQRYELIAFPLIVGSYLVFRGVHIRVLKAYLVAATLVAVIFPFDSLGLQKNPAAQFVANAILLLVGVPRLSRYRILVPLLVYGMFATESRGAILACGVGVAILLAFRWMHSPRQAIATGLAIAAIAGLSFELLPSTAQSFITTYGSQGKSHGAYNIRFRQETSATPSTSSARIRGSGSESGRTPTSWPLSA